MPFCFFLLWRYRRETDGLLFGVASGWASPRSRP